MGRYDADLQAAVDFTSVAQVAGEADDLVDYLRQQLAELEIETDDEAWLNRTVEGIRADRDYMIDSEPEAFEAQHG